MSTDKNEVLESTEPKEEKEALIEKKEPKKKRNILGKSKDDKLKKQIEESQEELSELKDKYLRLFAEFDNYKKRTVKERLDLLSSAAQNTITALLPVLDDFDRAKKSADDESNDEHFSEGVKLVYKRLHTILTQQGLIAMESTGEAFDPEYHEAISEIPAPDKKQKGKIIDTIEKGYLLRDKIIRHAKVVVGK